MTTATTEPRPSREVATAFMVANEIAEFERMTNKKQFIILLFNRGYFEQNVQLLIYATIIAKSIEISDEFLNYFYRLFLRGGYKYGEHPNPPPIQTIIYEDYEEDDSDEDIVLEAKDYL